MLLRRRRLVRLLAAMDEATSHAQWFSIAEEVDHLNGLWQWRESDDNPHLDAAGIHEDILRLSTYRERGDYGAVLSRLTASIHRHQGAVTTPSLSPVRDQGTADQDAGEDVE